MSTLVLTDIGATPISNPLRLTFEDGSGPDEVDFEVDTEGQLYIRPENGDMFLGTQGNAAGDVEFRTHATGGFIGDLWITTPNHPVGSGGLSLVTAEVSFGIGVLAGSNSFGLDTTVNNFFFMSIDHGGTAPLGMLMDYSGSAIRGSLNAFLTCRDSSGDVLIIASDGDVTNLNNSYGAISDESFKQDIVDANSQWDDFKAMRFRKWRFKADVEAKGEDAHTCLGCVAQELQATSPGLVIERTSRTVVTEEFDEDTGLRKKEIEQFDDGDPVLSTKYSVLYMKGMVALQEAMTRIEALEAQLA